MTSNDDLINSIVAAGKQATSEADQAAKQARERLDRINAQKQAVVARWPHFKTEFENMTQLLNSRIEDSGFYLSSTDVSNQRELPPGTKGVLRISLEPIGSGTGLRHITLNVANDGDVTTGGNVVLSGAKAALNIVSSPMTDFEKHVLQFALAVLKK